MPENKKKDPRKYPQEYPYRPERYTEEIVAIDRIEPAGAEDMESLNDTFQDCHRYGGRNQKSRCAQDSGTGGERFPEQGDTEDDDQLRVREIRQNSDYHDGNKAAPNNNIFFENRSNPLSSKGN